MTVSPEKSFGEELLRIIRAEIADYDARKKREAEVERLQRVAKSAAIEAESAARLVDLPDLSGVLMGDVRAKELDALADRLATVSNAKGTGSQVTYNISGTDPSEAVRATDAQRATRGGE